MEEKEELEPIYLDEIKVGEWIKEANYDLNKYVGFTLPVIVGKPNICGINQFQSKQSGILRAKPTLINTTNPIKINLKISQSTIYDLKFIFNSYFTIE